MKKFLTIGTVAALCLSLNGCFTLSWAHNRRHVRQVIDQLVQLHEDIDKVIFGLDRNPAE